MHDHFALCRRSIDVALFPGEVVVVLDVEDHFRAERARDVFVDEGMIRRGVMAHQVHRGPVFLARFVIEREPREMLQFLRQLAVAIHREPAVMLANLRARSARAAVREQREVFARLAGRTSRLSTVNAPNSTK